MVGHGFVVSLQERADVVQFRIGGRFFCLRRGRECCHGRDRSKAGEDGVPPVHCTKTNRNRPCRKLTLGRSSPIAKASRKRGEQVACVPPSGSSLLPVVTGLA